MTVNSFPFVIHGEIEDLGFEGDSNVPGGYRHAGFAVHDMVVTLEGIDVTNYLWEDVIENLEQIFINEGKSVCY